MKKFLSLVLTLFISGIVYAVPPQNKKNDISKQAQQHQQKMKQDFDKLAKELNVTEEQKNEMKQLMQSDISRKKEIRQQLKEKNDALDNELLKENMDMDMINTLITDIIQLDAEISKINIERKFKVRSILSFEQYTKMEQNRKLVMEKLKNGKNN